MSIDSKDIATHYCRSRMGHISTWYYLQHDGCLFRWSVKDSHWIGTERSLNGLTEIGNPKSISQG